MSQSLFKYFSDNGGEDHGGRLSWSAHLDAPFRGSQIPLLKDSEFDDRLVTIRDFKFKEFDLHDEDQRRTYQEVMDRIVNGWYQFHTREFAKDETGRVRYVYVEWSQTYTVESPSRSTNHVGN